MNIKVFKSEQPTSYFYNMENDEFVLIINLYEERSIKELIKKVCKERKRND